VESTRSFAALRINLTLLFLLPRLVLLFIRPPFYDELYTRWIGAKSFAGILAALHYDSGPPLYYFLVHALGDPSVSVLRALSLCFASGAFVLLLLTNRLGPEKYWAAALLAVYPPAVLLSVDARAYAPCAFFLAIGVLALDADRPFAAALSFVAGAYCHYYGVLFFPLLLLRGRRGTAAAAVAGLAYAPAFLLAMHQPVAATDWNQFASWRAVTNLSFAGVYPSIILLHPPAAVYAVALAVLAVAVVKSWRFAPYVLVPVALVLIFRAAGRQVYFPLRFESVVAFPLMLWLASSLMRWPRALRLAMGGMLMLIGTAVIAFGVEDYTARPADGCLAGAAFIREHVPPEVPILASAYCYLYTTSELGSRITPFPARQGLHPGWWKVPTPAELAAARRELPPGEFVWIGETTQEMELILRNRRVDRVVPLDSITRLLHVLPDRLH
jgi:hypothetical protein